MIITFQFGCSQKLFGGPHRDGRRFDEREGMWRSLFTEAAAWNSRPMWCSGAHHPRCVGAVVYIALCITNHGTTHSVCRKNHQTPILLRRRGQQESSGASCIPQQPGVNEHIRTIVVCSLWFRTMVFPELAHVLFAFPPKHTRAQLSLGMKTAAADDKFILKLPLTLGKIIPKYRPLSKSF